MSLSASGNHTCAVDVNMQAHCWGLNTAGQTNVPEPNEGFRSVHTGSGSSCGVKESGALECWTTNTQITRGLPDTPGYTDIVLGVGGAAVQSCGLTQDGAIDCWAVNQFSVEVPSSGPYTQIDSNSFWLCGLTSEGTLNCNVRTSESLQINARNQVLLNQVASLPMLSKFEILTQSSTITSMCGLTFDGTLECIGDSLPANTLPGDQNNPLEEIIAVENLSFSAYSDTTIELFWDNNNGLVDGIQFVRLFAGSNIYRDNELLAFTSNSSSFIDDTLAADQEYIYTVALVDPGGFEGPMSAPIQVATNNRGQVDMGGDTGPSLAPPGQPTNLSITRYGESSLEIFWERPAAFSNARYQVYRNGVFLASAPGPSYFDARVNPAIANFYTIVVLARSADNVIGVGFVNEPAFGAQ